MPTRNVVVTDAQETLIEKLVERGRFQNASEVMRAGLRLIEEREAELEEISERLKESIAQMERGEVLDGKTAMNDALQKALARKRK